MARPSGPKTRCSGLWTEAKYRSFIVNLLRQGTRKWKPISDCIKKARIRRGIYLCAECKEEVPASISVNGKRKKNIIVDHEPPVVDPEVGFTTYDEFIEKLFCEEDSLQALCLRCHDEKTKEERKIADERRRREKLE